MQKMCTFHLPECLDCNLIESCFIEKKRKSHNRIIKAPENNVTNLINLTREITERLSRTKPTF